MKLMRLDVQEPSTIEETVTKTIETFGHIDVWINNAGYGVMGPVEATTDVQVRRQFDVNYFGVFDCMRAVLPHFRERNAGTLMNISSVGGLLVLPLFGVYNSSKFALEGLTEGLYLDLSSTNIFVKLVEPGGVPTEFNGRSMDPTELTGSLTEYQSLVDNLQKVYSDPNTTKNSTPVDKVAKFIYDAATDGKDQLRYLIGKDAKQLWTLRRRLGYKTQIKLMRKAFKI